MSLDKANKTPIQIYKVPELGKFHTDIRDDFDFLLCFLFINVFRTVDSAYVIFLDIMSLAIFFVDGDLCRDTSVKDAP